MLGGDLLTTSGFEPYHNIYQENTEFSDKNMIANGA
jgi:hypothetical protein